MRSELFLFLQFKKFVHATWNFLSCLYLILVDPQQSQMMYRLHTEKQRKYFWEVIRLYHEEGYGTEKISRVLPVGHTTASRWIAIFAEEKGKIQWEETKMKPQTEETEKDQSREIEELQKRVKELEAQLLRAEIKAEFYDEMINVAEAKFKIPIRKKAGAKQ